MLDDGDVSAVSAVSADVAVHRGLTIASLCSALELRPRPEGGNLLTP